MDAERWAETCFRPPLRAAAQGSDSDGREGHPEDQVLMAKTKSIAGILGEARRHLHRAFGSILAQGSKTGLRFGDRLFRRLTLAFAFSIVALTLLIAYELYRNSVL